MEKSVNEEICQAIKAYLKYEGIAINTVAELLGSTPRAVSAQLSGRAFSRKTAQKYSEAFGFDADYLMTGRGLLIPNHEHVAEAPPASLELPAQVATMLSQMSATIQSQQETIAILVRNGDMTQKAGPRIPAKADPPLIK